MTATATNYGKPREDLVTDVSLVPDKTGPPWTSGTDDIREKNERKHTILNV